MVSSELMLRAEAKKYPKSMAFIIVFEVIARDMPSIIAVGCHGAFVRR